MARLVREDATPTPQEFRREVLDCHRRLTAPRTAGRWQVPWPRALGTPPWAVRRELEAVTGRAHEVHVARWSRATAYDRLAVAGGALYVGSRTLPRHVLLVLPPAAGGGDGLRCYEPSRGAVVVLGRDDLVGARLRSAGWPCPWLTVTPVG